MKASNRALGEAEGETSKERNYEREGDLATLYDQFNEKASQRLL